MPIWIPARLPIGYLTGAALFVAGAYAFCWPTRREARQHTWAPGFSSAGSRDLWPVMFAALADPSTAIKVEGINYFADTLLYHGSILALASATTLPE